MTQKNAFRKCIIGIISFLCLGTGAGATFAAQISGTVFDSAANPFTDGIVYAFTGNACDWVSSMPSGAGAIQANGTYVITEDFWMPGEPLPAGDYHVIAMPSGNYYSEWWDQSGSSTPDCIQADLVTVAADGTVTDINFQLDAGTQISGTVFEGNGIDLVTADGYVEATTGPCFGGGYGGRGYFSAADGTYTIQGMPAGEYYLYASTWDGNHVGEWWADPASTRDCDSAQPVTVGSGGTAEGTDFQLDLGAEISGTVTDILGSPVTGGYVTASTGTDPCGSLTYVNEGYISYSDGTYTIQGLPAGSYYLWAYSWDSLLSPEWWVDSNLSAPDCSQADLVTVTAGETVTDKNFQLDPTSDLSGTVTDSLGSPVTGGYVTASTGTDPCGSLTYVNEGYISDSDGTYTIQGLPAGSYYLYAYSWSGSLTPEWWADPLSERDCALAEKVTVSGGVPVADINFQLDVPARISGTVYDNMGNPVTGNGVVGAYTGDCDNMQFAGNGYIDSDGTYTISKLPVGDYYLYASPWSAGRMPEWWADQASSPDCGQAQSVPVAFGGMVTGKNFQLDGMDFLVTTAANPPEGGTITGGGTYNEGDTATLTASPVLGYAFTGWSGDAAVTDNPLPVTVDSEKTITANFAPTIIYMMTTAANPPVGGTVTGGGLYNDGDTATLTAIPEAGYAFSSWSGDAVGAINPIQVTVDSNKTVTANFTLLPTYTVTTSANPVEGGTVTGGGTYNEGDTATLTAIPEAGYVFIGWSGDATSSDNPLSVSVDSEKNITANFNMKGKITFPVRTKDGQIVIISL